MVKIIHRNRKASRDERMISAILTAAVIAVSATGCILGKIYTSNEALAAIGAVPDKAGLRLSTA